MSEISENKLVSMLDKHAKSLCCNRRSDGFCYTKEIRCGWRKMDEDFSERGITCKWFREAVLPADKDLEALYESWKSVENAKREAEYLGKEYNPSELLGENMILCEWCNKPTEAASNRQKYCSGCADSARRVSKTAYMRGVRRNR